MISKDILFRLNFKSEETNTLGILVIVLKPGLYAQLHQDLNSGVNNIESNLKQFRCDIVYLNQIVIGNELFCRQLCETLKICHEKRSNKHKLYLVACSKIEEVLYHTNNLQIDYVVFLLDTRLKSCAIDVDYNLQRMHKSFVCGRMCIINANPYLPQSETNVSMNAVIALKRKYDAPFLNGDVMDSNGCTNLAERLLTLIQINLGVKVKIPFIPWLFKVEKNE